MFRGSSIEMEQRHIVVIGWYATLEGKVKKVHIARLYKRVVVIT